MSNNLPVKVIPATPLVPVREKEEIDDDIFSAISAFESETAGVLARTSPKNERIIVHVLVTMLILMAVLSAVVKLDRIVTGVGEVVSVGGPLYVSPLNAGVVRDVRVKPGDIVKKGDVLATLDPTLAQADVSSLQQKFDSDAASIERLTAEHEDRPYTPALQNSFTQVQYSLWQKESAEYQSNLATLDAQVLNATALVNQYQRDTEQYGKRLELAQNRSGMFDPLAKKGYVSQLQVNTLEDAKAEASRMLSQSQNQLAGARQSLNAVRSQRTSYIEKWHAAVSSQMATVQDDYNTTREALEKAKKMLELGTLVAPSDAIVLKIGKVSTGAVASSMSSDFTNPQLFTLAPLDSALEAELKVPAAEIGFIRAGDSVTLKLDAYSFIRHGTAEGKIKTISEGTFTTDENNQAVAPYFKVRVAVTKTNLREVPKDFRLIPGMTLAGDVTVGKRTILMYLMEGALKTGSEAMREAQ